MNITFIVPDYNYLKHFMSDYKGSFHHGIAYISSLLKKHGHTVSLVHLLKPIDDEKFIYSVKTHTPNLIAFTCFTHQFKEVKRLAAALKRNLKVPIICGGVHATIDAQRTLLESDFDMVCIGEGEAPMLELAGIMEEGKDWHSIKNIWVKSDGELFKNPIRPLSEDLDELPFPDWSIFNYGSLTEGCIQKRVAILATRGCPNNCGFCCNHAIKSVYPNEDKYVRIRRPQKVIEEIDSMLKEYPHLESVCFLDDTMGLKADWLEELSHLYKSKFSLPVHLNTRVEIVNNDKKFESLRRMGVEVVSMGFESGDEFIRRLLNRKMSNADIIRAVQRCHEAGIKVLSYNIVGLPYENTDTVLKSIRLNVEAKSDIMHASIFQPYPNTDLYKLCVKEGFIRSGDVCDGFFENSILDQKSISKDSVIFAHRFFQIYVILFTLTERLPGVLKKAIERLLNFSFKNRTSQRLHVFLYSSFITKVVFNKFVKRNLKAFVKWMTKNKAKKIK
jgi:anaerobic magnesium-protoporphyrin IX monomethyl ester cyclase